jgi:MraZ protein
MESGRKRRLNLFLSTYTNKLDKKGRLSVPASFRAVIGKASLENSSSAMVAYCSLTNECIAASHVGHISDLYKNLEKLDPYSQEYELFSTLILGTSIELSFDPEGRVVLPEDLIKFANLDDKACFVGKGNTFEIWNPDKFEVYTKNLRDNVKNHRPTLHGGHSNNVL